MSFNMTKVAYLLLLVYVLCDIAACGGESLGRRGIVSDSRWRIVKFKTLQGGIYTREQLDSVADSASLSVFGDEFNFVFVDPFVSTVVHCDIDTLITRRIPYLVDDMNPELKTTTRWYGYADYRDTVEILTIFCPNASYEFEVLSRDTLVYYYNGYAYFFAKNL